MPLNWNDETIPSEADKTTDILGFKEIGGIGQLIYHPFRFKKYELDIDKSDDYCATPFCRPGYDPIFPKEDFLSGQGLLTSLCNLAMQINSFDNKIPYTQLIIIHIQPLSSPLLLMISPYTFAFIPIPPMCLSSRNRSISKAFRLILPCVAPVCEGMHYHKT